MPIVAYFTDICLALTGVYKYAKIACELAKGLHSTKPISK